MNRSICSLFVCLLLWLTASRMAYGDAIDATLRAADPRLGKKVSLSMPHAYLSEVLNSLAKQTGISIFIRDNDPASGLEVTAECKDQPVADVLNALCSLVSSQGIEWVWIRDKSDGPYTYRLVEPASASSKATRFRDFAQGIFEHYAATMIQLAEMSAQQRKLSKHEITRALFLNDEKLATAMVNSEVTWQHVRLFAETVPPEIQQQVLRGERDFVVKMDELPPTARELCNSFWSGRSNVPQTLHIATSRTVPGQATKYAPPHVEVELGGGAHQTIFADYFLERAVYSFIAQQWQGAGDTANSPAGERTVEDAGLVLTFIPQIALTPDDTLSPPVVELPHTQQWRFLQLAEGASVSLFAIFPTDRIAMNSPIHKIVKEYITQWPVDATMPMVKWRGETLLVSYPAWFTEDDNWLPYHLIKQYLLRKDGLLPLTELAAFMSEINDRQAEMAVGEYPVLQDVIRLRPLLALTARFPEMLTAAGMPLNREMAQALLTMPQFVNSPALNRGNPVALRLTQKSPDGDKRRLFISAEVLVGENDWESLRTCTEFADFTPHGAAETIQMNPTQSGKTR